MKEKWNSWHASEARIRTDTCGTTTAAAVDQLTGARHVPRSIWDVKTLLRIRGNKLCKCKWRPNKSYIGTIPVNSTGGLSFEQLLIIRSVKTFAVIKLECSSPSSHKSFIWLSWTHSVHFTFSKFLPPLKNPFTRINLAFTRNLPWVQGINNPSDTTAI